MAEEVPLSIHYDKEKDTLSLRAQDVQLKEILASVSMQSGIEVIFDDRADRRVTLKNRPCRMG